ncbi:hypothetical protein FRX31_013165 [Thalictrum thalictroides]|uniref:CCHC-type domain-containing protein n=1 Tax=Thalictrum thalictroides TaxID=46969 RepID=A0A7J6WJW8_THATH|nr:hypothetical protein FRX31_013165 [Thalictrum thalictroides]
MVGRGRGTRTVRTARLTDIEVEPSRAAVPPASTSGGTTGNAEGIPPWAADTNRLLQQIAGRVTQIESRTAGAPPDQNVMEVQNANVEALDHYTWRRMLESFMKMKPPKLNSAMDYTLAEDWKENMENLLDAMDYTEVQKQRLATLCLIGDASLWWKSVTRGENTHTISWDEFCRRFDLKYFPQSLRQTKVREFFQLKQGRLTVLEFETRFTRLARLVAHMNLNEFEKARQFEEGLRDELRLLVKGRICQSLREVVDVASYLEQDIKEHGKSSDNTKFEGKDKGKKFQYQHQGEQKKQKTESSTSADTVSHRKFSGTCYRCGRSGHKEVNCRVNLDDKVQKPFLGTCYRCGRTGHKESACRTVLPDQDQKKNVQKQGEPRYGNQKPNPKSNEGYKQHGDHNYGSYRAAPYDRQIAADHTRVQAYAIAKADPEPKDATYPVLP